MGGTLSSAPRRPLTRSSVKPRLLFPAAKKATPFTAASHNTEDEEADTDIEDQDGSSTPIGQIKMTAVTPKAPKFAPVSPPTTVRTTRSRKVDMSDAFAAPPSEDEVEIASPSRNLRGRTGRVSPFDSWSRQKSVPVGSKKRSGSPFAKRGGAKKLRSGDH